METIYNQITISLIGYGQVDGRRPFQTSCNSLRIEAAAALSLADFYLVNGRSPMLLLDESCVIVHSPESRKR